MGPAIDVRADYGVQKDENGDPPHWSFTLAELTVLASFYRRCAERGFAVYADF